VSQVLKQEVFMMDVATLAKVIGTSYAVAREVDQLLKKYRQIERRYPRYRKVRKVKKQ